MVAKQKPLPVEYDDDDDEEEEQEQPKVTKAQMKKLLQNQPEQKTQQQTATKRTTQAEQTTQPRQSAPPRPTAPVTAAPPMPRIVSTAPAPRPTGLLRRNKPPPPKPPPEPDKVAAGPVDKIADMMLNPTEQSIKGMTVLDRVQVRMFPVLDMLNIAACYLLDIASYRQDKTAYLENHDGQPPQPPNLTKEWLFSTSQYSKSLGGVNLTKASDLALAEVESRNNDDDFGSAADNYFGGGQ